MINSIFKNRYILPNNILLRIKTAGLSKIIAGLIMLFLLIAIFMPALLTSHDPFELNVSNRLSPPSKANIFGTDEAGRDIYTRVIYGTRYSLGMSVLIVFFAGILGSTYGIIAGYFGGKLETIMMRVVDLFLSFPYLILAMAIASSIGRGVGSAIIALVLVWWPGFARIVRGQVICIKENLFVESARAAGVKEGRILYKHILPHCFKELRVKIILDLGYAILALTGLSFLGLGVQNPTPEWGLMIANAKMFVLFAWWYGVFPGLAIFLSVLAFTLMGE